MTVEVLLRATIVFVFLMKMTENIQVVAQKNEVKAEEARL